ncbi:MAG: transposase [Saprospiraceae bacterium]|nr:transposase [Saprospiraceae bacterium]MCF8252468.1 transposase [Saprospiraceae bacterium]MCF8282335.1 transposase [Bacteroidales bacterium]MCF8314045.1 transposase [Saprospiraceae bacterium]MCF8442783.1 transposase [Saprospiraceae bacterium]
MEKQPLYQPGGIYHIFNHANGRENVFEEPENYIYFMAKYAEKVEPVVQTLAYCLMPNHFHFLVKVKEEQVLSGFLEKKVTTAGNMVPEGLSGQDFWHYVVHRQFHNFLGGYSKAFNKYHQRSGSLLRQNTRRKIVASKSYVMNALRYVHLNPVFHGFTSLPDEWPYSSYLSYLSDEDSTLPRQAMIDWMGGNEQFIRFHLEKLKGELEAPMES